MDKKIICVDFDGVLHSYTSGWQGVCTISDPPVNNAMHWLYTMVLRSDEFEIHIYSSRSSAVGGVIAMQNWLRTHLKLYFSKRYKETHQRVTEVMGWIHFPLQKPKAFLTIDDRAFRFVGVFPEPDEILKFKPWWKLQRLSLGRIAHIRSVIAEVPKSAWGAHERAIADLLMEIDALKDEYENEGGER